MDPNLDCSGGNPVLKESVKCVEDIMMNYDLVDIWRIRNPNRDDLKVLLNSVNITVRFDIKDVLFGILDKDNISILVNYILESKYFIYRCKLNKSSLCIRLLVDKFKRRFKPNVLSRKKNNKIHFHDKKWKPLLPLIQQ